MIHFEIPWNPNRLEQRNGRIDRHGQKAKAVKIHHFVGKGYNDRERSMADTKVGDLDADLEFLMRAVRKVEAIREDLGKVGPVIADQVQDAMLGRDGPGWTPRRPRPNPSRCGSCSSSSGTSPSRSGR